MKNIRIILFILASFQKKSSILLLAMVILMAIIDTIGIASILPFITLLSNPSLIETNDLLIKIFRAFNSIGVNDIQEFQFALGVAVFTLFIFSIFFKAITNYLQIKFIQMTEYLIGKKLIETYLHQPYVWFLDRNSSDLGKNILSEVQRLITHGIYPLIDLTAKTMVVIAIVILLIIADPYLALIVGFSLCGTYFVIYYFIRSFLKNIGKNRLKSNFLRFEVVSDSFGASKEVKAQGLENYFIDKFSEAARVFAQTQSSFLLISQLPRFILEAIAFGGVLLLILFLFLTLGGFNESLPLISLYVFAGYRLLPSLQNIYVSITSFTFVGPSLEKIYNDLNIPRRDDNKNKSESFLFREKISLKNISYCYPNSSKIVLSDISIDIPKKTMVGLAGPTGSGKTTIIDIILGLLDIQKGSFEIDGKDIFKQNLNSWKKSIGYVPQQIYLSDDTIESNIAFGVAPRKINKEKIHEVAKIANIHNFINETLPNKYQTIIGERGVKLSGGERQRIGIARALYLNPKILILDEATSALDNNTEELVMKELNKLNKEITIIIIAHRLNTLKNCDNIFFIENGELKEQGGFNELFEKNEKFKAMVNPSEHPMS